MCASSNVVADVAVVVGTMDVVGDVSIETVVVTLLVMIFAWALVLVVLWRCPSKDRVSTISVKSVKIMMVSILFFV